MDEYRKLQADAITKDDYIKAGKYLQELANDGNVEAIVELGLCYKYGNTILTKDNKLAKKWLEKAANHEHPIAMYEYGLLLPMEKRTPWIGKAFKTNDMYVLGEMYYYGIRVDINIKKSIEYSLKSNHPRLLNLLGNIYCYEFNSVTPDLTKAFEYYLKSANMGYLPAQYNVALCYEFGKGIEKI